MNELLVRVLIRGSDTARDIVVSILDGVLETWDGLLEVVGLKKAMG